MSKIVKGWGGAYVSNQDSEESDFLKKTMDLAKGTIAGKKQLGEALNEFTNQSRKSYATGGEVMIEIESKKKKC